VVQRGNLLTAASKLLIDSSRVPIRKHKRLFDVPPLRAPSARYGACSISSVHVIRIKTAMPK